MLSEAEVNKIFDRYMHTFALRSDDRSLEAINALKEVLELSDVEVESRLFKAEEKILKG